VTRWIYMVEWQVYTGSTYLMRYATETFRFPSVAPSGWGTPAHANINGVSTYSDLVVHGRIRGFPSVQSHLYPPAATRGGITIDGGSVVLDNADGALDRLPGYPCEGRQVRILRINADDLTDFDCLWHGTCEGYDLGDETVTIKLRGFQYLLDRTMMINKYAGTGLLEGGDTLKGKPKPFLLGKVYNVSPVLVHDTKLIYQLDGQLGQLFTGYSLSVYDKRAAIAAAASPTYASTTDLLDDALAPAAGQYKVFPGPGGAYIRLGARAVGAVTCDVTNPADSYTGSVSFTGGAISGYASGVECQRVLIALLRWWATNELSAFSAVFLDTDTAAKLAAPASQDGGIYMTEETTYMQAAELLLRSLGAGLYASGVDTLGFGTFGRLRLGIAQLVAHSSPDRLSIAVSDVLSGGLSIGVPADPERGAPAKKLVANWRRNFTVMGATEIDGTVSLADVAALGQEWRSQPKDGSGAAILAYPSAPTIVIDTAHYDAAGALDLAEDVLYGLYDNDNTVFRVSIEADQFDDFLTDLTRTYAGIVFGKRAAIRVAYENSRFGLDGTLDMWLLGYERASDSEKVVLILLPTAAVLGGSTPEQ
jgi:hypothetical protein